MAPNLPVHQNPSAVASIPKPATAIATSITRSMLLVIFARSDEFRAVLVQLMPGGAALRCVAWHGACGGLRMGVGSDSGRTVPAFRLPITA
jgi:hypothetical protein